MESVIAKQSMKSMRLLRFARNDRGRSVKRVMQSSQGMNMKRPIRWVIILILILNLFIIPSYSAEKIKNILSIEAYDMLNTVPDTYLIDIRTRPEYQFVGHPLRAYNFPYMFFEPRFIRSKKYERYFYNYLRKNENFLNEIEKVFKKTDNLLIMGRDGTRSLMAAKELASAGYKNVFHVVDGFEGPEFPTFNDKNRHKYFRQLAKRNKIFGFGHRRYYGWQFWGLPWTYDMNPKYIYPPDLEKEKKERK